MFVLALLFVCPSRELCTAQENDAVLHIKTHHLWCTRGGMRHPAHTFIGLSQRPCLDTHFASKHIGSFVCVWAVYEHKYISKEWEKQLGGPGVSLWISANILRSATRLSTVVIHRGAGAPERGQTGRKTTKKNSWAVGKIKKFWKTRIKVGLLWPDWVINKHRGERTRMTIVKLHFPSISASVNGPFVVL